MFSSLSYLERATYEAWVLLWFLWRMWSSDRFESLQWNHLRKFELKSMIALLISIGLPMQGTFDVIWSTMEYEEGFIVLPEALPLIPSNFTAASNFIIETPTQLWIGRNKTLRQSMQYLLCFSFALLTGTLFLVQAFWSHLTTQWGKKRFTTSTEFKLYIIFSIANFIIYPCILHTVQSDPILSESAPQFAFSCTLLVVLVLSFRNNRKLQRLYPAVQQGPRSVETLMRLEYFVEMNKYLSFGVGLITVSFMVLSIDAMVGPMIILKRVWADILISNFNFGALILWIVMILVIFPPNFYLIGMQSRISMSVDHRDPQSNALSSRASTSSYVQPSSTDNRNLHESNVKSASSPSALTAESTLPEKTPENGLLEEKIVSSVHAMLEQQERHMQQFRNNMINTVMPLQLSTMSTTQPSQSPPQSPQSLKSSKSLQFPKLPQSPQSPQPSQSPQSSQHLKSKKSSSTLQSIAEPAQSSVQTQEIIPARASIVSSNRSSVISSSRHVKTLSTSYLYI